LHTIGGFGLDKSLFLMDLTKLVLSELPAIEIFSRSFFVLTETENSYSFHWLLQEPLILGADLDIATHCYLHHVFEII